MSNSFRKVLVYFGLAEDREYYDDDEPEIQERDREPERELESRYQERPNVRRLSSRRRRDEIDDISLRLEPCHGPEGYVRRRSNWPEPDHGAEELR